MSRLGRRQAFLDRVSKRMRMMVDKHVVLALALLLPFGCAGRKAVWKEEGGETKAATVDVAALVAKGDASWEERTDPAAIRAALVEWEQAAEADPKNFDVLVKLTRGYYFLADGYLRDQDKEYL